MNRTLGRLAAAGAVLTATLLGLSTPVRDAAGQPVGEGYVSLYNTVTGDIMGTA